MSHGRSLLLTALVLGLAGCREAPPPAADAPARPNILWLVGENMNLDLGIYGAPNVSTPHLDALARQGLRYQRVFATSPVCARSIDHTSVIIDANTIISRWTCVRTGSNRPTRRSSTTTKNSSGLL